MSSTQPCHSVVLLLHSCTERLIENMYFCMWKGLGRDENTEIQSSNESYIDDYNHYYMCFLISVIINGWSGKTAFIR